MTREEPRVGAAIAALGYSDAPGLVLAGSVPQDLATRFAWEEIEHKVDLDAVFFQSGVPVVGFTSTSASDLRELRLQLWNYGRLPALVSIGRDEDVTVFNGQRSPLDEAGTAGVLASSALRHAERDLNEFSRHEVEAGALARVHGGAFLASERVDSVLLSSLRTLRSRLSRDGGSAVLSHADVVIGASILSAYLCDRDVLTGNHLIELCGQPTLPEALMAGQESFAALLAGLAERFNGDVFGPAVRSVAYLQNEDLNYVARFLRGENLLTGQGALWGYDFAVIPPEVISSVYETLLEEDRLRHASFYTPRPVVNLILDEVVPLGNSFVGSVADLSCGSGAFLTEAFRRLIFQRRVRGDEVDFATLSNVLTENVYGVDIDDFAVRLTVFGLYLALLEQVEPRTIWDEVVLPALYMRNIVAADAFSTHPLRGRQFDAIIGNPPWQSALSPDAAEFLRDRRRPVGDRQLAQAFVWLAEDMLVEDGRMGLVLPAKNTLYNRSGPNRDFRAQLFRRLSVRTIIDLSLIRRRLFAGAISPSVIIVADRSLRSSPVQETPVFLAVRPRDGSGIIDGFVVAPEDFKEVPAGTAEGDVYVWKALLWGSERDLELLRRLERTGSPLAEVAQERGWLVAQGIKEAGKQRSAEDLVGLRALRQDGMGQLRPARFGDEFDRETLHRRQPRKFFEDPKLVIGRTLAEGRIATCLVTRPAIFTSNLTGVSAPADDLPAVRLLALLASSSLIQYWQFYTSASWGVERPAIDTNEILGWVIPPIDAKRLAMSESVWRSVADSGISDDNRPLVDDFAFEIYGLTQAERMLVAAGVERSMATDRPGTLFGRNATEADLEAYRDALVGHLATGWESIHPRATIRLQGGYAGVKVLFDSVASATGSNAAWTVEEWNRAIGSVERAVSTTAVVSQPSLLYFDDMAVYLVKSRDADRWSHVSALSDGDDIYAAAVFGDQIDHR